MPSIGKAVTVIEPVKEEANIANKNETVKEEEEEEEECEEKFLCHGVS